MTTAIHRHVEECRGGREGAGLRVVARMSSGWAVMGESQLLPGYCLLLPDPVVGSLNDLDMAARGRYLDDMARLGDAVSAAVSPRRINYEILGNLEPALHAHVLPRFEREPEAYRTKAVWLYPPEVWNAPEHRFDAGNAAHARVREAIRAGLGVDGGDAVCRDAGACGLFQRAVSFAARAHAGHLRKDGRTPYIAHPFRVAMLVRDAFGCRDEAVLAAAVLHDTIEDTRTDYDDVCSAFGVEVASMVAALTKDKRLPEDDREVSYDAGLAAGDWRARLIKAADVCDNLADLPENPLGSRGEHMKKLRRALALVSPLKGTHPEAARACAALEARLSGG